MAVFTTMGIMAAASLIQSNEQRKAQMKAKAADARLQRAKLERARMRATEDYVANTQRTREAAQQREFQIEENRLDSEAAVDATFADSGISGQSIAEIDNELNAAMLKNKFENRKQLDRQLSDMAKDYSDTMSDTSEQAAAIDTTRVKGSFIGDAMAATRAGVQGYELSQALGFGG